MSLNNISLPPGLMAKLYHTSLIQSDATAVPVKEVVPFLSKNQKNILILVHHNSAPFLPDKELDFLTAVLSACALDLSAVAIVNTENKKPKAENIIDQFRPKQILFLDVLPETFGFPDTVKFEVQNTSDLQFLYAPSLTEIEKTKQTKSQFWLALKQLFNL